MKFLKLLEKKEVVHREIVQCAWKLRNSLKIQRNALGCQKFMKFHGNQEEPVRIGTLRKFIENVGDGPQGGAGKSRRILAMWKIQKIRDLEMFLPKLGYRSSTGSVFSQSFSPRLPPKWAVFPFSDFLVQNFWACVKDKGRGLEIGTHPVLRLNREMAYSKAYPVLEIRF